MDFGFWILKFNKSFNCQPSTVNKIVNTSFVLIQTLFIISIGISPSLIYLWFRRQVEARALEEIRSAGTVQPVTHWRQRELPADAQYIPGVGYLIGDITCEYNARSSFIRCAVNPEGPCDNCRFYQPKLEDNP